MPRPVQRPVAVDDELVAGIDGDAAVGDVRGALVLIAGVERQLPPQGVRSRVADVELLAAGLLGGGGVGEVHVGLGHPPSLEVGLGPGPVLDVPDRPAPGGAGGPMGAAGGCCG